MHDEPVDDVARAVVDLHLEAHARPPRLGEEAHAARERVPAQRDERDAPRLDLHDAHLHPAAQRQLHRQRLPLRHRRGGPRLRVEVHEAGRQLVEAPRELRHERVRVEAAALDLGPEALPLEAPDPLVRELLGLDVGEAAEPLVERRAAHPELADERVLGVGLDDAPFLQHRELPLVHRRLDAERLGGLEAERGEEVRHRHAHRLPLDDRAEALDDVVHRGALGTRELEHPAAEVGVLEAAGEPVG